MKWILCLFILLSVDATAKPLWLDNMSLEVGQIGARNPMLPDISPKEWEWALAANFDLRIFDHIYWRNTLHGETAYSKFMTVGWKYEIGFPVTRYLDFYWQHHSQHTLDTEQPIYYDRRREAWYKMRFPVQDTYGIRFHFRRY